MTAAALLFILWTAASVAAGLLLGACISYADKQETFETPADVVDRELYVPRTWVA